MIAIKSLLKYSTYHLGDRSLTCFKDVMNSNVISQNLEAQMISNIFDSFSLSSFSNFSGLTLVGYMKRISAWNQIWLSSCPWRCMPGLNSPGAVRSNPYGAHDMNKQELPCMRMLGISFLEASPLMTDPRDQPRNDTSLAKTSGQDVGPVR